jgi:hypothetical protein
MHGLTCDWLDIAVGWGYVATVLLWLVMTWAFPSE